jgi:DNA recombination protein RmuC
VNELGTHLSKYEEYHTKLGNALSTTVNQYNFSSKELKKIDKDVLRIAGSAPGIEVTLLEKPDSSDQ